MNKLTSPLLAALLLAANLNLTLADNPQLPATFCNPLPIPNYPIGRAAREVKNGEPDAQWNLGYKEQFRELADVTVLWYEGKWYLYPSVDMAWVSADNGASWQHHPLNVRDIGLDTNRGARPGAFRYRVELETENGQGHTHPMISDGY